MKKLLPILLFTLIILPNGAEAARLWSSGFELNSVTLGVEFDSYAGGLAPAIVSSPVHSGTYAMQIAGVATGNYRQMYQPLASGVTQFYVRAYVYVDAMAANSGDIFNSFTVAGYNEVGNTTPAGVIIKSTDGSTFNLYACANDCGTQSLIQALTADTWYRIEMFYDSTPANGSEILQVRLDGTQVYSNTSLTYTAKTIVAGYVSIFNDTIADDTTTNIFVDDVAFNDASGSSQTSWPGVGFIVYARPNASGDSNSWNSAVGGTAGVANNYTRADEVTPDDATSYNARTLSQNESDCYNMEDSSTLAIGSRAAISLVAIGDRAGATSNTANSARRLSLGVKSASGAATSTVTALDISINGFLTGADNGSNESTALYHLTTYVDPTTSSAWTPTGTNSIDNMQACAYPTNNSTTEIRLSALWALVEYVPTPSVQTSYASNVHTTSAILRGTISNAGGSSITEHGFATSTSATFSTDVSTTTLGSFSAGTGAFTNTVLLSTADTLYYYRAYALNTGGYGYGETRSFVTDDSTVTRKMRLFEGFTIKLQSNRLILYQQ